MENTLVKVDRNDWHILRNMYEKSGEEYYLTYAVIDNFIQLFEQDQNVKHVNLFCLNGDYSDGTFVMIDWRTVYTDTLNQSHENLKRLLQLNDFSNGFTFLTLRLEIGPAVAEVLQNANVEIAIDDMTLLYRLRKEEALKFDVNPPDGIELRPVTKIEDIEKINSIYPIPSANSLYQFKRLAKYNPTVGAYKDGILVAWLFRYPNGLIGALQTDEKYYGRGYATLVCKYLCKRIAKLGHDVYSDVYENNAATLMLGKKLNFEKVGKIRWIRTKILFPIDCSDED